MSAIRRPTQPASSRTSPAHSGHVRQAPSTTAPKAGDKVLDKSRAQAQQDKLSEAALGKSWEKVLGKAREGGPPKLDEGAMVAAWAKHFEKFQKNVPDVGDRGTVGSFEPAQLKVIHQLFFTAPPGAEWADIAALAKKHPAFKGRKEPITDNQLKLATQYRPESFPFSWSDRKRSICSFFAATALAHTPADIAADKVLGQLRKDFDGFLSEVALKRMAADAWMSEPKIFPGVSQLQKRPDGKGYVCTTLGPVIGLPKFGGKIALSAPLAERLIELAKDPRIQYGWEMDDFLKLIGDDIGEKFTLNQWRHLRESYPSVPDWFTLAAGARERWATQASESYAAAPCSLAELAQRMEKQTGYLVEESRFVVLRNEFPHLFPMFKATQVDALMADAEKLVAALKKNPDAEIEATGHKLGFDHNRIKGLVRIIRLKNPKALPLRKAPNRPFTDAERKLLRDAVQKMPVGGGFAELWETMEALHPKFFEARPLAGPGELGRAAVRELGIEEGWYAHQRGRFEEVFVKAVKHADAGVTLVELLDHMRDEHGVQMSYTTLKLMVRDAEAHPGKHPAVAALQKAGRYPWDIGTDYTEALAKTVAAVMRAHPNAGQREHVGILMKAKAFRDKYPQFGTGHIYNLRTRFPEIVPYIDDIKTPFVRKQTKSWAGKLDALAERCAKACDKLGKDEAPSVAVLTRKLGVDHNDVRKALVRNPELFPWYRRRPTGMIDLELAYRVGNAMEKADFGTSLGDIAKQLKKEDAFDERYPSFSRATIFTLRELYPDVVPEWHARDKILRSKLLVDALRAAPEGTSFEKVAAQLDKKHPGAFDGMYADEAQVRSMWKLNADRFPFAAPFLVDGAKHKLAGRGEKLEKTTVTASEVATRCARLARMPTSLPLVDFIADQYRDKPLESGRRYEFMCVQHLLDSQVPVFDTMKKLGMMPSRTTIIGVPYSASDLVVQSLEDKGWDVRVPPLDMDVWIEDVRGALYERLESALAANRDIAVMDDGGIVSKLVAEDPLLREHADKFKIVEQTRRGITVADEHELASPVVNVAQSWGKYAEGPFIASDVEEKVVERLEKIGVKSLKGKKVGVVGGGTIGNPIAAHLKALGAEVTILDPSEHAQALAKKAHLRVADPDDRKSFFAAQDIIIGATGMNGITAADLASCKSNVILGSASSKLVEIDVAELARLSMGEDGKPKMRVIDDKSHPPSVEYELNDGRKVRLLARGFPVNFDGAQENIPFENIQLTRALMLMGLLQATGSKVAGVKRLDPKAQIEMLEKFQEMSGGGSAEQRRVLKEAMDALQHAVDHPGTKYRRRGG